MALLSTSPAYLGKELITVYGNMDLKHMPGFNYLMLIFWNDDSNIWDGSLVSEKLMSKGSQTVIVVSTPISFGLYGGNFISLRF